MEAQDSVTLTPIDGNHSTLRIERDSHEWAVPGLVLEYCQKLEDGRFLLLTTDNSPYEEALHVMHITSGKKTYELINIGQPYTPAIFKHALRIDEGCIEFSFADETRFRATVFDSPRWKISTLLSPSYIKYVSPLSKKSLYVSQL